MPVLRFPTKQEAEESKKEYLSVNTKKWKIIKKVLGEEVAKHKRAFTAWNLTPPKITLQPRLWQLYTNKDFTKPIPPLSDLGEILGRKVFFKFKELGYFDDHCVWHAETPEERYLSEEISRLRGLPKEHGKKKLGIKTRLPGLVSAIQEFKKKPSKTSIGDFKQFLSKKEYTRKTPYQIDQYDLYVDEGLIYHRDRSKKNKKGKTVLRWDRPIKNKSLDRYYYDYIK